MKGILPKIIIIIEEILKMVESGDKSQIKNIRAELKLVKRNLVNINDVIRKESGGSP